MDEITDGHLQIPRRILAWHVLLVVLLLPLYYWRFSVLAVPTNFIEVAVAFLVINFIWYLRGARSWKALTVPHLWPISLLIIGLVIGAVVAVDHSKALGILKGWFIVPMVFGFIVHYALQKQIVTLRQLMVVVTVNVGAVSLYVLLQYFGIIALLPSQQDPAIVDYLVQNRAIGFFESPNYVAMYLVPPTVFVVGLAPSLKKRLAIWSIYAAALSVLSLLASQSRAGLLALGVGLALVGAMRSGVLGYRRLFGWVSAVLIVAVVLALISRRGIVVDGSRLTIWRAALKFIGEHPVFGIGPGQFQYYFAQFSSQNGGIYDQLIPYALHPHNIFLAFYLAGGLLGLAGFIWLLVKFFQRALSVRSVVTLSAAAALGAILVHGLFDTTYFKNDLAVIFWTLLATGTVSAEVVKMNQDENRA